MLPKQLRQKKIEHFKKELARDYLAFFYNASFKKHHFKEMIHLLHYRYFKEFTFLSTKESQCLYLAGKGKTILETASILKVGFDTAREYREKSIKKINATNITEAAVKYYHPF